MEHNNTQVNTKARIPTICPCTICRQVRDTIRNPASMVEYYSPLHNSSVDQDMRTHNLDPRPTTRNRK